VLKEITTMPEFWSTQCIRQKVKSPVEFIVGILRQFDLQAMVAASRPATSKPDTPLPKMFRDTGGLCFGSMYQQGLALLYPPDVSGWHWGTAWLSSSNMAERMKFSARIFGAGQEDKVLSVYLGNKIKNERKPTSAEDVVDAILDIFDADFGASKRAILIKACADAGNPTELNKPQVASNVLHSVCKLVFSSPEFQMC
jgi:uncharacterized protein (DUF1800 family)